LAIIILHAITGVCTPACLLAASISVEAVTPPLVGWAFKELPLFCGGSDGKSNARGIVSITPVSRTLLSYGPARGYGQGFGGPFTIVIVAETNFVVLDSAVAVIVTLLPFGTESGAR